MRQSTLFFKIQNDFPSDELAENARFLIRGNFIHKLMAGVYSFLPLGFRVRNRIIEVIRQEMNAIGSQEILMPAIHPKSIWEKTGRWETLSSIMYQFEDHYGKLMGLGATHEEIIADLFSSSLSSYADLPLAFYQIQTKFRDEARAKSGLLRCREFTMKDLYSFHADEDSLSIFYEKVKSAYKKIFIRFELDVYITEASGGDFSSEFSHEFMVPSKAGEDIIFLCRKCRFARNKEIANIGENACPLCNTPLFEQAAIEVGNIFKLGTKFSKPQNLFFKNPEGIMKPIIMASYGIGIERLMGTLVEIYNDKNGICWPQEAAPFQVHLLTLGKKYDEAIQKYGNEIYSKFSKYGIEILFDDTNTSPGEKLFIADFIGIPWRVVVSSKTLENKKIEVKKRNSEISQFLSFEEFIPLLLNLKK